MVSWYQNIGFRWKLTLPMSIIVLLVVGLGYVAISTTNTLSKNAEKIATINLPEIQLMIQADRDLYQSLTAERSLIQLDIANHEALLVEQQENAKQAYDRFLQSLKISDVATDTE